MNKMKPTETPPQMLVSYHEEIMREKEIELQLVTERMELLQQKRRKELDELRALKAARQHPQDNQELEHIIDYAADAAFDVQHFEIGNAKDYIRSMIKRRLAAQRAGVKTPDNN
jgi:hypothetical protein